MSFSFGNINGFVAGLKAHVKATEKEIAVKRRAAVELFMRELMKNMPVWSGRTVSSITASNTGAVASLKGDPSPSEIGSFGRTSKLALGLEPMRTAAEAKAMHTLSSVDWDSNAKPVFVTVYSEAWALVEQASAPDPQRARNTAIVSALALSRVKAQYSFLR